MTNNQLNSLPRRRSLLCSRYKGLHATLLPNADVLKVYAFLPHGPESVTKPQERLRAKVSAKSTLTGMRKATQLSRGYYLSSEVIHDHVSREN